MLVPPLAISIAFSNRFQRLAGSLIKFAYRRYDVCGGKERLTDLKNSGLRKVTILAMRNDAIMCDQEKSAA